MGEEEETKLVSLQDLLKNKDDADALSEQLRNLFQRFDKDGNGVLDQMEVKDELKRPEWTQTVFNSALSDEFIDKLFDAADGNNDGTIDFDEFIKIVTKMIANDFTDIL